MSSTHVLAFFRLAEWHVGSVTLFVAGGCGRERGGLFTDSRGKVVGGAAPAFDVEVCTSLHIGDRQRGGRSCRWFLELLWAGNKHLDGVKSGGDVFVWVAGDGRRSGRVSCTCPHKRLTPARPSPED